MQQGSDIDEDILALSDERVKIAFDRACREFSNCVADYESEAFIKEFNAQLAMMVMQDELDALVEDGLVQTAVNDDGMLTYAATDAGQSISA